MRPSPKRVKARLHYNERTGKFTWKSRVEHDAIDRRWNTKWAGQTAGSQRSPESYVTISIDGTLYRAHILAFVIMNGRWPKKQIDHKDGVGSNNRWKNLREASCQQNQYNSKIRVDNASGFKGVSQNKHGSFVAYLNHKGTRLHLGSFPTAKLAAQARNAAASELHGEFSRKR